MMSVALGLQQQCENKGRVQNNQQFQKIDLIRAPRKAYDNVLDVSSAYKPNTY